MNIKTKILLSLGALVLLGDCLWLYFYYCLLGRVYPVYLDKNGKLQLIIWKVNSRVGSFHNGLATYTEKVGNKDVYGYINKQGKVVIPAYFEEASPFDGPLTAVVDHGTEKWINQKGQVIIALAPGLHSRGPKPSENLIPANKGDKTSNSGYVNQSGKLIIPAKYAFISEFRDGLAAAAVEKRGYKNGKRISTKYFFGFLDEEEKFVIPPTYQFAGAFKDGLAVVAKFGAKETEQNGHYEHGRYKPPTIYERYGFIDKNGIFKIPPIYLGAHNFKEGLAAVLTADGKWGYINKQNVFEIKPTFLKVSDFAEGVAAASPISDKQMWGYIDKKGNWKLEAKYAHANDFYNEFARVEAIELDIFGEFPLNGEENYKPRYGLINKTGKYLFPPTRDQSFTAFSEGLFGVYGHDN